MPLADFDNGKVTDAVPAKSRSGCRVREVETAGIGGLDVTARLPPSRLSRMVGEYGSSTVTKQQNSIGPADQDPPGR